MAIHIQDKEDFDSRLKNAGDQLVVVDFFAIWCGNCKMIAPELDELAKDFADFANALLMLKVDVDECECQDIAAEYQIPSIPTFIFIKNQKVVTQFSGANYDKLKQLVVEHQ